MSKHTKRNRILSTPDRTPEQWAEGIELITDPRVKQHAACVIWWRVFSKRGWQPNGKYLEAWPHLDKYVDGAFEGHDPTAPLQVATDSELYEALLLAGMSQSDAESASMDRSKHCNDNESNRRGSPHRRKIEATPRYEMRGIAI